MKRIHVTAEPARIVLSKPGYDASTPLTTAQKVLDSDWMFTGHIVEMGWKEIEFSTVANDANGSYTMIPVYYNNPLTYVPAVYAWHMSGGRTDTGTPPTFTDDLMWGLIRSTFQEADLSTHIALSKIYSDRIEIPDKSLVSGAITASFKFRIGYMVFGV